MSRGDIAHYLHLAAGTVGGVSSRFRTRKLIAIEGRELELLEPTLASDRAGAGGGPNLVRTGRHWVNRRQGLCKLGAWAVETLESEMRLSPRVRLSERAPRHALQARGEAQPMEEGIVAGHVSTAYGPGYEL